MSQPESAIPSALQAARDAFATRAWARAHQLFSELDETSPLAVEDLEQFAVAAYMAGETDLSTDAWKRAQDAHVRAHDARRAARCTFWLVMNLFDNREWAQGQGWLARGLHLLDESRMAECPERGLLYVALARKQIKDGEVALGQETAQQAVQLSVRCHDHELDVFSRLVLAQARLRKGDAAEAAPLCDEIMVSVIGAHVSPIAVGTVYCAVIEVCHAMFDFARAREWTAALSQWCGTQSDLVSFRGECMIYRSEIMRMSGAWSQASAEAEQARDWLNRPSGRTTAAADRATPAFSYRIGAAYYQLAEIHRLRGEFADADFAYSRASEHGYSTRPGLALLRLAQGRTAEAAATIRRLIADVNSPKRADVLAACVEIMIAASDIETARASAQQLAEIAASPTTSYLHALAAQAAGAVLLAEARAGQALAPLREAWMAWQEIDAPYEAARVRVLLGLHCRALGDEAAAQLEFAAALRVFERLFAVPDVTRVNALRSVSRKPVAQILTARERQVIQLLATGRTNRAIARELRISERTVDRHVSNILLKLNLRTRTAATAYAYEHSLI